MRQLTFAGFTKQYVTELSLSRTTSIRKLVWEAESDNPRLREPLLLYAIANGKTDVLVRSSYGTKMYSSYREISALYEAEDLLSELQSEEPRLKDEYRKVWKSYMSICGEQERNDRVKGLYRKRILELQACTGVSTYRICKELGLNNANVNAWLKHDISGKVGLEKAREMFAYLSEFASQNVSVLS